MPFILPFGKTLKKRFMYYPTNIDIALETVKEVTSTNDYLSQLCKEGKAKEFYTLIAEYQTGGKGQRGNTWESERGKNLTFSIVFYPTAWEAKHQFTLSMLAALSCREALGNYIDGFSIKWPNDIYWKDQKIGGILIENEVEGKYITQSIIGIGLNVNQDKFYSDAPNPVSLKQILGVEVNLQELLMSVVHCIVGGYRQLEIDLDTTQQAISTLYRKHLYRSKGLFPYRDAQGEFLAEYQQVEPNGHLILKDEQGMLRRYAFKEVSYIL